MGDLHLALLTWRGRNFGRGGFPRRPYVVKKRRCIVYLVRAQFPGRPNSIPIPSKYFPAQLGGYLLGTGAILKLTRHLVNAYLILQITHDMDGGNLAWMPLCGGYCVEKWWAESRMGAFYRMCIAHVDGMARSLQMPNCTQ